MRCSANVSSFDEKTNKEVHKFNFKLELEEGEDRFEDIIDYIHYSCGCTSGTFNKETGELTGEVRLANVGARSGILPITKYITVYLDKNENYFVADPDTLERRVNASKRKISLQIAGNVKFVD